MTLDWMRPACPSFDAYRPMSTSGQASMTAVQKIDVARLLPAWRAAVTDTKRLSVVMPSIFRYLFVFLGCRQVHVVWYVLLAVHAVFGRCDDVGECCCNVHVDHGALVFVEFAVAPEPCLFDGINVCQDAPKTVEANEARPTRVKGADGLGGGWVLLCVCML